MGKIDEIAELAARLGGQAPQPKYIRAYHGSPGRERILASGFDPSLIGSNSGTGQGHGYYFSSNPAVTRHYGDGIEVEIAIDPDELPDAYRKFADQWVYREPFYAAVSRAPENKWKGEAVSEILRSGGTPQLAYQSLLRAYNVGDGAEMLGRFEAGRRASEALRAEGIQGMQWMDDDFPTLQARNLVVFPGAENQIRILRKLAVPGAVGAGAAGAMQDQQ